MAKKIYKRRRSRFDPYRGEIEHLLATGCTTSQITDAMQVHFGETYITESSVYYYIKNDCDKGSQRRAGIYSAVPRV